MSQKAKINSLKSNTVYTQWEEDTNGVSIGTGGDTEMRANPEGSIV